MRRTVGRAAAAGVGAARSAPHPARPEAYSASYNFLIR